MAFGNRAGPLPARAAAERRGAGARLHLPVRDHRLCGGMARARDAVLDHLPLASDGRAGDARPLAVLDLDLAGACTRDRDRACTVERRRDVDPGGAVPVAALAEHAV